MWLIQTPVAGLQVRVDTNALVTLTGEVPAWNHVVRSRDDANLSASAMLASAGVRWEIRPWYERRGKIFLREGPEPHEALLEHVRGGAARAVTLATFPNPGKRHSDSVVTLLVIVPPSHFERFQSLVHVAMTLPAGAISITLPTPLVTVTNDLGGEKRALLTRGTACIMDGLEFHLQRAPARVYSEDDLRSEQRNANDAAQLLDALDEQQFADWFHFRRIDEEVTQDALTTDEVGNDESFSGVGL